MAAHTESIELSHIIAVAADSKQGEDIVALDVSGPLAMIDIFVLVTGLNERNVQAIADEIEDAAIKAGRKTLRREGRELGRWILLDFGDVVAHIFHEEERAFYGLERLWHDCPVVPLEIPATAE